MAYSPPFPTTLRPFVFHDYPFYFFLTAFVTASFFLSLSLSSLCLSSTSVLTRYAFLSVSFSLFLSLYFSLYSGIVYYNAILFHYTLHLVNQ